tara:strand:- start:570 stop:1400 length:831 start_codon:yes stop_codon:yes gene_type:complete
MNFLFLGDIVGERSVSFIKKNLRKIIEQYSISFVVANGENVANGYGIKPFHCEELWKSGIDVISTGNHVWDQQDIIPFISKEKKIIRPQNYSDKLPGSGYNFYVDKCKNNILVINLACTLFMKKSSSPFQEIGNILRKNKLKKNCDAIIVDIHGEAASEKQAFASMIDGKVTAVLGSHTHVPTADLRVLPNGTAFQTDAGMCGDYNSVIGGEKNTWIAKFTKETSNLKINSANVNNTLCGSIISICKQSGLAKRAEQIIVGDILENKIPDKRNFME